MDISRGGIHLCALFPRTGNEKRPFVLFLYFINARFNESRGMAGFERERRREGGSSLLLLNSLQEGLHR